MKILILSMEANGLSLGWRLRKEGHDIKMWVKKKEYEPVGEGFLPKVDDWETLKDKTDFFIVDDGYLGKLSETLKKEGKAVWGGTETTDQWEEDRGKGQKVFKEAGMTIIPSNEFSSVLEAISWLRAHPGKYVVKPSGPIQEEKTLTYVAKRDDGSDLMSVLEQYKTKWASKITKLELQEVKEGIEVAVTGYFNGTDFVEPILINFEHKKLMPGNIGPASGEMGTSACWMGKRKIYKETLGKVVKPFASEGYTGCVDINCIVSDKTIWPLEFTSRWGYPTTQLEMETIKGNMGEWMYRVAKGQKADFKVSKPYSVCVVMATPPYPFHSKEIYKRYSLDQMVIFGGKDRTGIWPGEVLRDENNDWFLTGDSGYPLICTGSGKTLKEARTMCYKRIESLTIPHSFYRNDIGENSDANLATLAKWGWFV